MNKINKKINKVFKKHGGFARTNDILAAGIHRRDIKRMRDEGWIIRVKRGLYRLSEIPLISNQGYIDLAQAVPDGDLG
jgi:predicted transcriptional regulator of viral defense system